MKIQITKTQETMYYKYQFAHSYKQLEQNLAQMYKMQLSFK